MSLVVRILANALAIWVAAAVLDGVVLELGADGAARFDDPATWFGLALVAVVFTVVNALVRPIVELLALPLVVLTLGLFLLVVNAGMVLLTAAISSALGAGLAVDGFWSALWAAIVIGMVNWVLGIFLPLRR